MIGVGAVVDEAADTGCVLVLGTDALKELVEFDFVLELSVSFSFFFLGGGMGTSLTAKRSWVSRCSPGCWDGYRRRWRRRSLSQSSREDGTSSSAPGITPLLFCEYTTGMGIYYGVGGGRIKQAVWGGLEGE